MKRIGFMRRLGIACAALLVAGSVIAQSAPPDGPGVWTSLANLPRYQRVAVLEREAKREGTLTIYGALGIDRAQILNKIFNERYPDIKVDFVRLTEPELVDKVLLEQRTGRVNSDLALSTVAWMGLLPPALDPYEVTAGRRSSTSRCPRRSPGARTV